VAKRVYLRNYPRLLKKLQALREQTRDVVAPALGEGADRIVKLAKSLVPVDSGDLRDSIDWTFGKAPKGSIHIAQKSAGDWTITIFAGNAKAYYARFVEFGTKFHAAQASHRDRRYKSFAAMTKAKQAHYATPAEPFFFPAWRALRKQVARELGKVIREAVRKVATQS